MSADKIKVVWLCSFANKEIAAMLGSDSDFFASPWITELIDIFRDRDDIKLSIISPNYYTNNYKFISVGNIDIYLYKYRRSFVPVKAYNLSFNYNTAQRSVLQIIEKISPDLVHLHGSENPLYSASALRLIDKYPLLVTVQGFVFLSTKKKSIIGNYIRWNRVRFEKKVNAKTQYFSVGTADALKTFRTFNNSAKSFNINYPTTKPTLSSLDIPDKKYEIVYFARITKDKGIEDLIEAVKSLKVKLPDIKVIVIGSGNPQYIESIHAMIDSYGLKKNIEIAGFQATQQDVFKLAAQAKVSVLPTYFDALPGSIREAMMMRIPVVAYAVGGIPTFNDVEECVTLVQKGDIAELADKIELVLNDSERTARLVENSFRVMADKYDNGKIYDNLISIYNNILNEHPYVQTN